MARGNVAVAQAVVPAKAIAIPRLHVDCRYARASHPGDLGDELASFTRAMRAENVKPNTIIAYGGAVRQFGTWLLATNYRPTWSASSRATSTSGWDPFSNGRSRRPLTTDGAGSNAS